MRTVLTYHKYISYSYFWLSTIKWWSILAAGWWLTTVMRR